MGKGCYRLNHVWKGGRRSAGSRFSIPELRIGIENMWGSGAMAAVRRSMTAEWPVAVDKTHVGKSARGKYFRYDCHYAK